MFQETQSIDNQINMNLAAQNSKEKHLISDLHFQYLTALRDDVYQTTEVNPTIPKLLYLIIFRSNTNSTHHSAFISIMY